MKRSENVVLQDKSGSDILVFYSNFVKGTGQPKTNELKYIYPCLGLAGEAGEVIEHVKKYARGDYDIENKKREILLEMGDVLWYLTRLANDFGFSLEQIIEANVDKLIDRRKNGKVVG